MTIRYVWALSLVSVLSGCPVWGSDRVEIVDPPDDYDAGRSCEGVGCECYSDYDCTEGTSCNLDTYRCEETTPPVKNCITNGDCDQGLYCDGAAGTCTNSTTCTDDSSCDGGYTCDFRYTCVPPVAGHCDDNSDCAMSEACVENECRDVSQVCQFSYECGGDGKACVDNACTSICASDDDCSAGQTCTDGLCRSAVECATTDDCQEGEHCVDARCLVDSTTTSCADGETSGSDSFCRPDWQPHPFCTTDDDCNEGHVCHDGACRTPCPSSTNDECLRFDSQLPICAEDNLCYSTNETMPECHTARDCESGSCVDATCR